MTTALYTFHKVAPVDTIIEGARLEVSIGEWRILVCRHQDRIYAVENRCSHQDEKLTAARIRRSKIICPVHGSRFDLETGAPCNPPATRPIRTFAVRTFDGILEVGVPAQDEPAAVGQAGLST